MIQPDGVLLVNNLTFTIEAPLRVMVTGDNGCGKSSVRALLLLCVACVPQLPTSLVIGAMTGLCAAEESFQPHSVLRASQCSDGLH